MQYSVIILAAGSGVRSGLNYNKILYEINGKKVLDYSIDFFVNYSGCKEIILMCSEHDFNYIFENYNHIVDRIIIGGKTRQESVYKGLNKVTLPNVLIHDSARPYINQGAIGRLLLDLQTTKATTLAVFVTDSIVKTNGNRLGKALDRSKLLQVQTPQAFSTALIKEAHEKAIKVGYKATDDTDLIAKFTDVTPSYVEGDNRSIKLTTKHDLKFLEVIL